MMRLLRHTFCLLTGCLLVTAALSQTDTELAAPPPADTIITKPLKTLRNIVISGNRRTKAYIIEREFAIEPGKTYENEELTKKMRQTREQLMNSGLYVDVIITPMAVTESQFDIYIEVKERWYVWPAPYFRIADRDWNNWINKYGASLNRVNIGAKLAHNNTTGRNDKLNLYIIGGYTQQFAFNYFQPYAFKSVKHGFNVGFTYARNREVNFATDSNKQEFLKLEKFAQSSIRGELGYSYRPDSRFRLQARVAYDYEKFDPQIIDLNHNMVGGGRTVAKFVDLNVAMQYYHVDFIPYPLRGWYVDVYALKRMGKGVDMLQIGAKFLGTWEFLPKTYFAVQAAAIARTPSGQAYFNSRLLGYGDIRMQGLEYYVADGTMGGMLRGTVRHKVFEFHIRNLFKSKSHNDIPFKFYLKTFGNLGYAYNKFPGNSIMNNKLLRTGGFGLDIVTIYDMALKLEFSFNQFEKGGMPYFHTHSDF